MGALNRWAALACILLTNAGADAWDLIGTQEDAPKATVWLDRNSVHLAAGERQGWIRYNFDPVADDGTAVGKVLWSVKCSTSQMRHLSIIDYGAAGEVLRSGELEEPLQNIPAGSVGELIENAICQVPPKARLQRTSIAISFSPNS